MHAARLFAALALCVIIPGHSPTSAADDWNVFRAAAQRTYAAGEAGTAGAPTAGLDAPGARLDWQVFGASPAPQVADSTVGEPGADWNVFADQPPDPAPDTRPVVTCLCPLTWDGKPYAGQCRPCERTKADAKAGKFDGLDFRLEFSQADNCPGYPCFQFQAPSGQWWNVWDVTRDELVTHWRRLTGRQQQTARNP